MKKQNVFAIIIACTLALTFIMVGCSNDETKSDDNNVIAQVLDTATSTVSEKIANKVVGELAQTDIEPLADESTDKADPENFYSFSDILIQDGKMFTVSDNALHIYDYKTKLESKHAVDGQLQAVAFYNGAVYVGGDKLYQLNDTTLEFVDSDFDGTITELYNYGTQLMIGTTNGLYRKGVFGKDKLMDNITVSAITEDNSGLWIGSKGEGLYRWDGENFQKRFLRRDTTIFNFVNAIDFKHDHLYVGCDNGLYVYDGGKWKTLTTEDGLPDNNIRAIDATDWTVYVGTDKGVSGYYNEELTPVNKLEQTQVNALKVRGRKLVVATEFEGVIEKKGNVLITLVQPVKIDNIQILSLLP